MRATIFRIIMPVIIAGSLNGCGQDPNGGMFKRRPDTDVTSSPEYNFKSFAGTFWKTKVKTALGDIKAYTGVHLVVLLPPDAFDPTHPEYRPPPYLEKVIAVLPVGTRLRIDRLMKDNGTAGLIRVTASLEDEATASLEHGKDVYVDRTLLAKNRFLRTSESSKEWGVDPDILEKAELRIFGIISGTILCSKWLRASVQRVSMYKNMKMADSATVQRTNEELAREINDEARTNRRSPYAGKFVGIANGQVVAVSDSLDDLARRLRQCEPDSAKTFCIEAGLDYHAPQEIWKI
jgi:hypothetical protein